jgi:hypothetical protein
MLELLLQWATHELLSILVAQSTHMLVDGGTGLFGSISQNANTLASSTAYELLFKRDLLELHAMNASAGGSQQRRRCNDKTVLHLGRL